MATEPTSMFESSIDGFKIFGRIILEMIRAPFLAFAALPGWVKLLVLGVFFAMGLLIVYYIKKNWEEIQITFS